MARLKYNQPLHGMGPKGRARDMKPLKAGAHMPQRAGTGYDDARGYRGSDARRNGAHTGAIPPLDTRPRRGPEGNSKGSPPGGRKSPGSVASHMPAAGRGAPGRMGGKDNHQGKPKKLPETMSSREFERLGAD